VVVLAGNSDARGRAREGDWGPGCRGLVSRSQLSPIFTSNFVLESRCSPSDLTVHDVAPDGRVLLSGDNQDGFVFGVAPGETKERSLDAPSLSSVTDITHDGRFIALTEFEAGGLNYDVYLRRTDGSAPVRIGSGVSWSFSPD